MGLRLDVSMLATERVLELVAREDDLETCPRL